MVSKKNPMADDPAQIAAYMPKVTGLQPRPLLTNRDYADADIIHLSAFIRDNPNPIVAFSPDGGVLKTNPAAARLLKRLSVEPAAILPADHVQIVTACLKGQRKEYTIEVTVNASYLALTYHVLPAFNLVYLYAIELTDYRQAETELLRIALNTIDLAKQAVSHLQAFRQILPQSTVPIVAALQAEATTPSASLADLFVSMDGCVFGSVERFEPGSE